jgi:micrococcal nuclease
MKTVDKLYHYKAKIVKVHDGDTIIVDLDLGMYTTRKDIRIRFYGIQAPEIRGPEKVKGYAARDHLKMLLSVPPFTHFGHYREIIIQTIKDRTGKFGRLLGIVWLKRYQANRWININKQMVRDGHAIIKNY